MSRTSKYVDKSSPEIARYRICIPTARAATVSLATYAFYTKFMTWAELLIAVYAWPLPEVASITIVIETCTACGQPAIDDL